MPPTRANRRKAGHTLGTLSALELRAKGLNFEEIGKRLNCHKSTAWRRVMDEMAKAAYESSDYANDLLGKELAVLDMLLDKAMVAVEEGDIGAISKVLDVLERRSRYLGLDKPTKLKAEVEGQVLTGFMTKEQMLATIMAKINKPKMKGRAHVPAK